ncbi:hypothetical protein WI86_19760, partial [Burkholderia ubonensis]
ADVHYTNAALNAGRVSIKAGEDLTLRGAHVSGDTVALQVGGDTTVTSVQDRHHTDTQTWGVTVSGGGAVGVNQTLDPVFGVIANPTGNVGAHGSHGWDDSRTTVRQAGIDARQSLTAEVKGDVKLVGGHLVSESGAGSVKVGGRVTALDVVDQHDKDGNSGGGNIGIKSDGLATVAFSYGKDDQVRRTAVRHGTLAVQDLLAGGGIVGSLNREVGHVANVTDDRQIAGSKLTVEVGDLLEHIKGRLKSKSRDTQAEEGASGGSRQVRQSAVADAGKPAPAEQSGTSSAKHGPDRYAQRVIVQQGDDDVTAQAARDLAAKHPENTTLVKADPKTGKLQGLEQVPQGTGNVKVQVVGHGDADGGTLGEADAPALAKQIGQVKARLGHEAEVAKVALVGCQTACGTDEQPSLRGQVQTELTRQGTEVGEVKGRDTYVKVDPDGRKVVTTASDRNALGKDKDMLSETDISENGRQENQVPMKAHYFWDGKNIPEESLRNILLFASMNPDYDVNVWTSRPGAIFSTLESMRDSGVASSRYLERSYGDYISVKNIGDLYSDLKKNFHRGSEIESIYHREKSGPYRNYAAASDVSRLAILHVEGGLYMDVDVMASRPVGQLVAPLNFLLHREGGLSSNAVLAAAPMAEPTEAMLTQIADSYKKHNIVWTTKRSKIGGFDGRLSGTVAISGPGVQQFIMEPRGRHERKEISVPLDIFGHQRKDGLKNIPKEREFSEIFMSNFDPRLDGSGRWEKIRPGRRASISGVGEREPSFPSIPAGSGRGQAVGHGDPVSRTLGDSDAPEQARRLRQATSSQTSSSVSTGRMETENGKPLVRVAWEDPKSAAAQNHEIEQAFSTSTVSTGTGRADAAVPQRGHPSSTATARF